jgi:hypothetical protein
MALERVFGGIVVDALNARVTLLRSAMEIDIDQRNENLHELVTWLAAVAVAVELESPAAADLAADLAVLLAESEPRSSIRSSRRPTTRTARPSPGRMSVTGRR